MSRMGPRTRASTASGGQSTSRRSTATSVNRCELFDEADLDAALATFEQLSRPAPLLENTASQVGERYREHFAAGDWDAMAATILADDFFR